MSASDRSKRAIVTRMVAAFMARLSNEEQSLFRAESAYVDVILGLFERGRRRGSAACADLEEFTAAYLQHLRWHVLYDRRDPLGRLRLLDDAIGVADGILAHFDRLFRPRYGEVIADPGAARSFAWHALAESGRQRREGKSITNELGLLHRILYGNIVRTVDSAMRNVAPGARAHYHLVRKHRRELREQHPDWDEATLLDEATRLADEDPTNMGRFVQRASEEDAAETLSDGSCEEDFVRRASSAAFLEEMDRRVRESDLSRTHRDTWATLREVGGDRKDIDWEGRRGILQATGNQRVQALFRELRRLFGDDWDA